jgi:hypothetical protein
VIAAIAEPAQTNALAMAGPIAVGLGTQLGRVLTRVYRLLRTPRIDEPLLTGELLVARPRWRKSPRQPDPQLFRALLIVGTAAPPTMVTPADHQSSRLLKNSI